LVLLLLAAIAVTMLMPLAWMISTSLKGNEAVFAYPPKWIPEKLVWGNYLEAWNAAPFGRFYLNSIWVSFCITFGQVSTSALAAYAFARLQFPGRDKVFFAYLATLMIPGAVTMLPLYILLKYFGWIDTYKALILPGMFSAYGTFMLRQFFMGIPVDLEDAARIDGCSRFGIFMRIILPLSKPALATLTTFVFIGSWREFLWPMVVTQRVSMRTLPVGLSVFQGMYSTEWQLMMAAAVYVMAPLVIVFLFCQRFFIEGIKLSGMKG